MHATGGRFYGIAVGIDSVRLHGSQVPGGKNAELTIKWRYRDPTRRITLDSSIAHLVRFLYRSSLDSPLEGDGFELPVREHHAGTRATELPASNREAAPVQGRPLLGCEARSRGIWPGAPRGACLPWRHHVPRRSGVP